MLKVNLYKQHSMPYQLSYASSGNNSIINNPMYHQKMILYKGLTQTLEFSCLTQDRKTLKLEDKVLFMYIQNREGTAKWIKELYPVDISWGKYEVEFSAEEVEDLDAGFYKASFVAKNEEGQDEILYTGANWETEYQLEVISNQYDAFTPSEEILPEGWLYVKKSEDEHYFESDWIKADNSNNHGFAFYFDGYMNIEIKGSEELEPTHEDKSWFTIDVVELQADEPTVINKFYQLACKWIKFEVIDTKPIEKILYRN